MEEVREVPAVVSQAREEGPVALAVSEVPVAREEVPEVREEAQEAHVPDGDIAR